jgi:NAD(P)H-hydrate repair Nnr-like enzyme with NAD(P)H-hydrate epimerase domain
MTAKEKAKEIIDYIAGTHEKQYGKVHMKSVISEASENAKLIIKNRLADGLDVTYWRLVRIEINALR